MLAVLLAAYAFNFVDRQILSVALESIKKELVLSDTQLGLMTGMVFAVFYSVAGIPIARWADRGHRPWIISSCLALLGATVALCGMVTSYLQLLLVRIGVGVGEAGVVPPSHSLIATYFDRSERLRAMSVFLLGGPLSVIAGYLGGGWLTEFFGWRTAFLTIAVPGAILALLVGFTIRETRDRGGMDGKTATVSAADVPARPSIREVFTVLTSQRTFRNILLAFAVEYLFGYGLVQWLPVFFIRVHDMSTGELGTWMALNWGLGNALGTFAGGYLTPPTAFNAEQRQLRLMACVSAVYVPINIIVLLAPEKHLALACMFLGALINALNTAPAFALIQTLVPQTMRATAVAGVFLLANLIGLGLGPFLVGVMSDALTPSHGPNAIRLALLVCTPGYLWVAAHYFKASLTVTGDLSELQRDDEYSAVVPTVARQREPLET